MFNLSVILILILTSFVNTGPEYTFSQHTEINAREYEFRSWKQLYYARYADKPNLSLSYKQDTLLISVSVVCTVSNINLSKPCSYM